MSATTKTLTITEIPEYLQKGELYRTLVDNNNDPNEEVTFPANALKSDTTVVSLDDCELLLNSMRFWGATKMIVKELVSYALANPTPECIQVLTTFETAFDYIPALIGMVSAPPADRATLAIKSKRVELVQGLAALTGEKFASNACELAAEVGSLEILLYLHQNGCSWSYNTPGTAARHGHMHIYTFLCDQGFAVSRIDMTQAVIGGHLEIVEFMHSRESELFTIAESFLVKTAIQRGHVHILRFFDGIGVDWTRYDCDDAVSHLNCLQFLHEHDCLWGDNAIIYAALGGHLDSMRYMHEQGCPLIPTACTIAAGHGHLSCRECDDQSGTSKCAACERRLLDCLQYFHSNGCPWDRYTCAAAARYGHLPRLQFLHENGCPWDKNTCSGAANYGFLNCLQYAHEHGCEWDSSTTDNAARFGHLSCLQYAHQNGCPLLLSEDMQRLDPLHNCYAYVREHAV